MRKRATKGNKHRKQHHITEQLPRVVGLSLAHEYPHAKVLALDISAEQYPPAWTRPANMEFGLWNFFDPLPDELAGRFDVVHIRAICAPLVNGGRDAVIKKLVQMLSKFQGFILILIPILPVSSTPVPIY